jgi:hypothetical protein
MHHILNFIKKIPPRFMFLICDFFFGSFDCGYHAIYNVEKWDGQNVPPLAKDDVPKLRRVLPHRWLTTDFNKEKENWKWNLFNNVVR